MIRSRKKLIALLFVSSLSVPVLDSAADELDDGLETVEHAQTKTEDLEALRDKIKRIQSEIEDNREESSELRKLLEQNETDLNQAIKESKELDEKIRQQKEQLENLKKKS